jgi:hypothetical protein
VESQMFDSKTYTLSPVDLIPDDNEGLEEDDVDLRWVRYAELARTLDTDDLMAMVGEAFSTSDLLRTLIEEAKAEPYRPDERKRVHVMDGIRLGEEVAQLISQAMDDLIGQMDAGEVPND